MSLEVILSQFEDVQEAISIIKSRIYGIESPLDFLKDEDSIIIYDSIAMRLQTIGESIKNVDKKNKSFLLNYSEIEWQEIMKLRDIISHHYKELNADIIFYTCKEDIPALEKIVEKIISDLNEQGYK
ncbi:MAG: HepT-like ribonuclease domain-containing protein [Ignavibacteriota bacterium]